MKTVEILPGTHVSTPLNNAYTAACHGHDVEFVFNDVRVIMYRQTEKVVNWSDLDG